MRGNRENRFLVDPTDKDAVDRLYRRSATIYFAIFCISIASGAVSAILLTPCPGENTLWVSVCVAVAVLFIMPARYTKRIKPAEQFVYDQLTVLYEGGDDRSSD